MAKGDPTEGLTMLTVGPSVPPIVAKIAPEPLGNVPAVVSAKVPALVVTFRLPVVPSKVGGALRPERVKAVETADRPADAVTV
jgi:hypothetical protein